MTSLGSGLRGNTLHSTSISEETVGVVVEELETGLVEAGGEVSLSHGKTDGIGETLSKRTSGDLNTGSVVSLGVTGGLGSELLKILSVCIGRRVIRTYTEGLEVIKGQVVSEKVEKSILEHTSVSVAIDDVSARVTRVTSRCVTAGHAGNAGQWKVRYSAGERGDVPTKMSSQAPSLAESRSGSARLPTPLRRVRAIEF